MVPPSRPRLSRSGRASSRSGANGIPIDHRIGTCSNTVPIEGSEYTPKASTIVPCHPLALSTAYTIDMSSGSEAPSNRRYPRITRSPGSSVSFVSMTRRRRPTIEKRATNPLPTNSSIASASVAGSIPTIALILRKTDVSGREDPLRFDDGGGERDGCVQYIVACSPHGVRRVRFGRSGWHCRHGHHAVGSGYACGYGMATPTTRATPSFIGPPSPLERATVGNDAASSLFDEGNGREVG